MMVVRILLLLINLISLKCASTDNQKDIEVHASEAPTVPDIISSHLDAVLLHKILEFDAKSTGRVAMANRNLRKLATDTRKYRLYEGAGWDMPELANVWKCGVTDMRYKPALAAEIAEIMELSKIKDEATFNNIISTLLFKRSVFKELVGPVFIYIIRRFYVKLQKGKLCDKDEAKRRMFLIFAFMYRLYDVFFEFGKDPDVWNGMNLGDIARGCNPDCIYFDCYDCYVFKSSSASSYMWEKMAKVEPNDYGVDDEIITPGGTKLSQSEFYAWGAVCIHRRVPEEKYVPYLSKVPHVFIDIIKDYIYKYSPITFDDNEKEYFHILIVNLLEKYFGDDESFESVVRFNRLMNDIRFGYVNENICQERILTFDKIDSEYKLEMLIMAASKANNQSLVKQLANHPDFSIQALLFKAEIKCPHCFKVYFDMIESEPLQDAYGNINYANHGLIQAVIKNNFKITKTTTLPFGDKLYIETPVEYVKLGFASKYEFIIKPNLDLLGPFLIEKMFNDAAKVGADELIQLITEHCGEQVIEENFIRFQKSNVSYEVIQILIKHQELVDMLAYRSVHMICRDERIKPEEIAKFRHVINPNT